jgi:1,4-alpha-glucan branching enzyme
MIEQTSISYYGLNYVEHAEADFAEMKAHGVTCVILAVTEFDFDFWRPNIPKIVDKAHELGLRVLIDPWGNGKYFGG